MPQHQENSSRLHAFSYKQRFYKQRQAEFGRLNVKQMLGNTWRLNISYLKIIHILHPRYHPKIIGHILENKQKKQACIYELTRLIIMKIKITMKHRSHRHGINRPRSRLGHKYSKYRKCLSMMMLICIQQKLSNISSQIHEKFKERWGRVAEKGCL